MLDTVEFRIHDLDKHRHLVTYLEDDNSGITKYSRFISKKELSNIYKAKKNVRIDMVKYGLSYNKITNHSYTSQKNKLHVPSSNHDITYTINPVRDYIHFNFSIPKYIFGHNIAQFVTSPFNKNFEQINAELKFQKSALYKRFVSFMKHFIQNEFVDIKVDLKQVEIVRLDICFNQYFHTKKDALSYLDIQKQIKFNRKRQSANINCRPTSITYLPKGKTMSFKIYHKGSEYANMKSKKDHKRVNLDLQKLGQKPFFDVNYLQKHADNILRYEATFRSSHFDLRYMNKPTCETHQYVGAFRKNSKMAYKQRIAFNKLRSKQKKGEILQPNEKSFFSRYQKHLDKSHKFMLETSWDVKVHEKSFDNDSLADVYNEATFSKNMIDYLFDEFMDYVKAFQISEMPTIHKVISKIKQHNIDTKINKQKFSDVYQFLDNDKKSTLPKEKYLTPIISFLRLLEKYTLNEIRNLGIVTKATYYRRLADLRNLGIHNNNISGYSTINTDLSFSHYYGECISNGDLMFPNPYTKNFF